MLKGLLRLLLIWAVYLPSLPVLGTLAKKTPSNMWKSTATRKRKTRRFNPRISPAPPQTVKKAERHELQVFPPFLLLYGVYSVRSASIGDSFAALRAG